MTEQDFQKLLEFLEETPEMVRQLTAHLSEENLKWKPSADEFSALEQVCHLRDLEREGYHVRIGKILAENQPTLPDFDGGRIARERDYNNQNFETALRDFTHARQENLSTVRTLSSDQLNLSGVLEGVGHITLARLLQLMREHDQSHLGELSDLRMRLSGQNEKQNSESRIQEPEEKKIKSGSQPSILDSGFWILNSGFRLSFCLLNSAFPFTFSPYLVYACGRWRLARRDLSRAERSAINSGG